MQHNFKFGTSGSSDPPKVLPSNTRLQRDHSSPLSLGSTTAAAGQGCQVAKWGPVIATVLLASNFQTPEKKTVGELEMLQPCLVAPALTLDLPLLVARASVFPGGTGIVGDLQGSTD